MRVTRVRLPPQGSPRGGRRRSWPWLVLAWLVPAWLVLGVAVEELGNVGVIDAGEAPGGQRGQDVRVRAGRRPGLTVPPFGQRGRRAAAALAVGTGGAAPGGRLATAEPAGVLERHAERDREPAVGARIDLGDAEIGARRGIRVLVVRGEVVGGPQHLPPRPLAA